MKIYTKTGDKGETSLFGGSRVLKSDTRLHAYGTVDELNSYIGLIGDLQSKKDRVEFLRQVQNCLFVIGSSLAADPSKKNVKAPEIKNEDAIALENAIDEMEKELEPLTAFILPGGHPNVSHCHIARCVCRRAERYVIELHQQSPVDLNIITYLNRLSDYLFVLARMIGKELGTSEIKWITSK